jgi:hypothetical protein
MLTKILIPAHKALAWQRAWHIICINPRGARAPPRLTRIARPLPMSRERKTPPLCMSGSRLYDYYSSSGQLLTAKRPTVFVLMHQPTSKELVKRRLSGAHSGRSPPRSPRMHIKRERRIGLFSAHTRRQTADRMTHGLWAQNYRFDFLHLTSCDDDQELNESRLLIWVWKSLWSN